MPAAKAAKKPVKKVSLAVLQHKRAMLSMNFGSCRPTGGIGGTGNATKQDRDLHRFVALYGCLPLYVVMAMTGRIMSFGASVTVERGCLVLTEKLISRSWLIFEQMICILTY